MMLGTVIITLLASSIAIVIWKMKRGTRLGFSRTTHFIFMGSYIALLIVILIVSELMAQTQNRPDLKRVSASQQEFDVDRAIITGKPIPEEELLIERLHEVKGSLTIKQSDYGYNLHYYIERSKNGGNQVIERVYRPSLINGEDSNGYDISNYVQVNLPKWTDDEVNVPMQPTQKLVFTSFHDSNVISQFTNQQTLEYYNGYSMRSMKVYLIVPDSVQLNIQLESDSYNEITRD
ncbi:hypothetical protein DVB69_13990 [Sporosarcina sp. BI001-red]|uniref:hypothetical protein n=1 Tax=Sporosarcina sp. BI001-red TaxID=2282866 RepID=UPI000E262F1E|nr:hypothetical protein [Sporosarcina sp. BI001-red]REB06042.1 hypothetical protein DVB69_13990 [Sporosarcina sp. BI001-red]